MNWRIIWYGPFPPTEREKRGLRQLYGPDAQVEYGGRVASAKALAAKYRDSGADDLVVVAPLAKLHYIIEQGITPIWPETRWEEGSPPSPEDAVRLAGKRWLRLVGFHRLTTVDLTLKAAAPATTERPVTVAWCSEHDLKSAAMQVLRRLYGDDVHVEHIKGRFRSADDLLEQMRAKGAHDLVVVAPWGLYRDLCAKGVHPLYVKMSKGWFKGLRRLTEVVVQTEPILP